MAVVTTMHRTDPASRVAQLGEDEVRELNAVAALLESLAVRRAPAYDAPRRASLRAANATLRSARDPVTAAIADHEVHRRLVEASADPGLLATLRPVRAALRPLAAGGAARDVRRHADEHDAVIAALAAGDHARAAERLRRHVAGGLPALLAGVAGRTGGASSPT